MNTSNVMMVHTRKHTTKGEMMMPTQDHEKLKTTEVNNMVEERREAIEPTRTVQTVGGVTTETFESRVMLDGQLVETYKEERSVNNDYYVMIETCSSKRVSYRKGSDEKATSDSGNEFEEFAKGLFRRDCMKKVDGKFVLDWDIVLDWDKIRQTQEEEETEEVEGKVDELMDSENDTARSTP